MKYARLYKVRGKWELTIGLDIECNSIISIRMYEKKADARLAAQAVGAKPVNF